MNILIFLATLFHSCTVASTPLAEKNTAPVNPSHAIVPSLAEESDMKTPAAIFGDLEQRLLNREDLTLNYNVVATGAFTANLKGSLHVKGKNKIKLKATGTFGGKEVVLQLESDGTHMVGGNGTQNFDGPAPKALGEALIIGLTRMGVLHNLARLTIGAPPDRAEGGVQEWVQITDVHAKDSSVYPPTKIGFDLLLAGQKSGIVELDINTDATLLVKRLQHVTFPTGEMRVTEEYSWE